VAKSTVQEEKQEAAVEKKKDVSKDLIQEEQTEVRDVTWEDWKIFLSRSTGPCGLVSFCVVSLIASYSLMFIVYWISFWAEQPLEEQQESHYPIVMGVSLLGYFFLNFARVFVVFYILLTSATKIHTEMVTKVIRSKIVFFDSNPVGRILTRFSKDISVFDLILPQTVVFATLGLFRTISVVFVVIFIDPIMIAVIVICVGIMLLCTKFMVGPMNEAQKMDSVHRGPIHSSFTNLVNGLVSLRVLERSSYFRAKQVS